MATVDKTPEKIIEDELKNTKILLEEAFEQSPIPMVLVSMPDGILRIVNTACREFVGMLDVPNPAGKPLLDLKVPYRDLDADENPRQIDELPLAMALRGMKTVNEERIIERKDGTRRWELVNAVPIYGADGKIMAGYLILNDITERKEAEKRINSLLREKEIILKEVHHRIKNNLNTMISLLSLQASMQKDSSASAILKEAGNRLKSMGLLYDKLYRSNNLASLSIKAYLSPLVEEIIQVFPSPVIVKARLDIEDISLKIEQLSAIGILVNEIVTNSMKYAFQGRSEGIISAEVHKTDQRIKIMISDNGIGMPETIDFQNNAGFGLQLVGMLADQISGTIKIERDNGTKYILEFSLD